MADMKKAQLALDRAKYKLMQNNKAVFITNMLFSLSFRWDSSCPTASTNGLDLAINPDFWLSVTETQRIFVLFHEPWHVVFNHMGRMGTFDPVQWNKACDHAINIMAEDAGYDVSIPGILKDRRFVGMQAEEIYHILVKEKNQDQNPMPDIVRAPTPQQQQSVTNQVQSNIVKATMAANAAGAGNVPGFVQSMVKSITNPPIPWQKMLLKYMFDMVKSDFSYKKPSRRHFPDYYLPTLNSPGLEELACGMDRSGSVSEEEFGLYIGQLNIGRALLKPKLTSLITFDTKICDVYKFKATEKVDKKHFSGRGGTNPQVLLDYYNAQRKKPNLLIIFSDMDFPPIPIENKPSYPVIWVAVNARRTHVNFGKVVEINQEQ